ncbi:hypothetical protein ACTA71_001364 [Dictyostelium dimigraforme]
MKLKFFSILLLFSIFFHIIKTKENCDSITPGISFDDAHCDSDYYTVVNPTVYINNTKDYDRVQVIPDPISSSYISSDNYVVVLDFGKTYYFYFVNDQCAETAPIEITTKNGPRFKIIDPPCTGSLSTVDFIPDPTLTGVDYTFSMDSNPITLPIQLDAPNQYQIEVFFNSVSTCRQPITTRGSNNTLLQPIIKTINPICGESNGIIKIENYNSFTSIVLSSADAIQSTGPGVFSGLNAGKYTITTIDSVCGERSFSNPLSLAAPPYQLEFLNFTCPALPVMQLIINTTQNYQIRMDSELVGNPFDANYYSTFSVEMDCGINFDLNLNLPSSYPLIQYTYEEGDYCQPYTISLIGYNSSLYPTFSVFNSSSMDSNTIELDANHSFVAKTDIIYNLQDNCFSSPLPIGRAFPKPIYNYLNTSDYCVDYVDIQIYNAQDFYYIELIPYEGEQLNPTVKYSIQDGYFRNVSNQQLYLQYRYRDCSEIQGFQIGNMNRMDGTNLDVKFNVTRYPTCFYVFGEADVKFYRKNTTDLVASFSQDFFYFGEGSTASFYTDFEFNCGASVNGLDLGDFIFEQAHVNIMTEIAPPCKYSQGGGAIRIDSNTQIISFRINGINLSPYNTSGNTYYLYCGAGNIVIDLTFSRQTQCDPMTINYFVEPKYGFSFTYQTTNVTDCTQMDGSIFIQDWDLFTILSIDSAPYVPGPDFWLVDLQSKSYAIYFEMTLDDGSICGGTDSIFVPSLSADIYYTIINQPLCSNDPSGSVSFEYVTNFPNQPNRLPIDYVYQGKTLYKGTIAGNLLPGTYIFNVTSGYCAWLLPITFTEIPIDITYRQLWYYLDETCQIQAGYQFRANNSLAAGTLTPFNSDFTTVGDLMYGTPSYYIFNVDVYYATNQVCKKTFEFLYNDYNYLKYPQIEYTIIRKPDCLTSDQTYDIQITNPEKWSNLFVGGLGMDSNGIIKGVVYNMDMRGTTSGTNCMVSSVFRDELYNDIEIDEVITDETCHGSKNGQIEFTNNQYDYYPFSTNLDGAPILLPLSSSENKYKYKQLTTEEIHIERMGKNILKSTCKPWTVASIQGNEPTLIQNINDQCSLDGFGSINYQTSIQGLDLLGYINLDSNPEQPFNGTLDNVKPGSYPVTNLKVTNDYCLRNFDSLQATVGASIFSINVNSSICELVIITPLITTSTYPNVSYRYNITSPSNKSKQYTQSNSLKLDSFEEFGLYTLEVSDGHCIQNQIFNVSKCLKPIGGSSSGSDIDSSDDGSGGGGGANLGLAIGLPIGLVGLGAIVAAGVFLYRKRQKPIKANELPPLSHEMETVSTFQGGRIVEIDKF